MSKLFAPVDDQNGFRFGGTKSYAEVNWSQSCIGNEKRVEGRYFSIGENDRRMGLPIVRTFCTVNCVDLRNHSYVMNFEFLKICACGRESIPVGLRCHLTNK